MQAERYQVSVRLSPGIGYQAVSCESELQLEDLAWEKVGGVVSTRTRYKGCVVEIS